MPYPIDEYELDEWGTNVPHFIPTPYRGIPSGDYSQSTPEDLNKIRYRFQAMGIEEPPIDPNAVINPRYRFQAKGFAPELDDTRYRWTMPMPPRPEDEVAPIQIPTSTPGSGRMVAQPGTPFYTNMNPETGEYVPNRIWASNTKTGALTQMPLGEEDTSQFVGGQRIFPSPGSPGGRDLTLEERANVAKVLPTGRYIGDEGKDTPGKGEAPKTPQSYQDRVNRINEITNEVITWARKSPINQKYAVEELEFRLRDENLHNIKEPKPIDLSELNRIMDSFKEPVIDHSNPMNPKVTGYRMNWAKYNLFAQQYGLPSLRDRDEILMEKERRAGTNKEKPQSEGKGKSNSTGKVR